MAAPQEYTHNLLRWLPWNKQNSWHLESEGVKEGSEKERGLESLSNRKEVWQEVMRLVTWA